MSNPLTQRLTAIWLFSTLLLGIQSCDDDRSHLEKSKVQFLLSPGSTEQGRAETNDLPEDARLKISIESPSGSPVFTRDDIKVSRTADGYRTDPLELLPGSYVVTDFMVMDSDDEVINATPKSESLFSNLVLHALPYNFSVSSNGTAAISMQVINTKDRTPRAFGYASFKMKKANTLSFMVSKEKGARTPLKDATGELRQGKNLIKTFSVRPGANKIVFDGEVDATYTLYVFAGDAAKATTFNLKALKKELGAKPLKISLEPALLLTIGSSLDESNEYGEYFDFALEGTGGKVKINWGDGHENDWTLPFVNSHEYTTGDYTAIITGDLDQITNLYGFAYSTIMYAINGLTNLTNLRTYNPSWGAVPIKVDLSNCKKLETIYIEKYGAPYVPIDLRTEFKLPDEHNISRFVFYVPSLDPTREFISPDEFEVLINNIYNNTVRRNIDGGQFFVYPLDAWSPAAQQKMDILRSDYHWDVRLDGNIWDDYSEVGRTRQDLNASRERWLREKFPDRKPISRKAEMALID